MSDGSSVPPEPTGVATQPQLPMRVGEYAVVRKIGEGGMGAVYLAEDAKLGRKVAVKTMRAELAASASDRSRFLREARAAAAVEHDNIVPIWGIGEAADGSPFIAMPLLQGETLADRLAREPVLPLGVLLKVAREVAAGLAAAHAKGLIHRDIKPGNVWLEGDPGAADAELQFRRCKILDFGLARPVETADAPITVSGAILGTPAYMAPEQARGEAVDGRADLWSLGALLYRAATGKPPFAGPTAMAVLLAVTSDPPTPVRTLNPHLPPALAALIERLLCKDPSGRPQSAAEVAATARRLAAELPDPDAPTAVRVAALPSARGADPASDSVPRVLAADSTTDRDPEPRAPKSRRAPWVIAAVVLCALVAVGVAVATRGTPEPDVAPVAERPKEEPKAKGEEPKPKTGGEPKPAEPPKRPEPEPKPSADPDRTAADYVRSLGGCVWVNEKEEQIKAEAELPKGPLRLNQVQFLDGSPVTDAGLAAFAGCRNMLSLGLSNFPVGDAGLAHFTGCKELRYLYLSGTNVTTAGLKAVADCVELLELDLSATAVDDDALAQLKRYTQLHALYLKESHVSAKGVAELEKALPGCQIEHDSGTIEAATEADRKAAEWVLAAKGSVSVNGEADAIKDATALPTGLFRLTAVTLTTPVKDADLAVFQECKSLTGAYLSGSGITNAGLAHFKECKGLTSLDLSGAKVDDKAVPVLKGFTKLADLSLILTDVSEKGAKEIAKALPGCRIQHNSGPIGPK